LITLYQFGVLGPGFLGWALVPLRWCGGGISGVVRFSGVFHVCAWTGRPSFTLLLCLNLVGHDVPPNGGSSPPQEPVLNMNTGVPPYRFYPPPETPFFFCVQGVEFRVGFSVPFLLAGGGHSLGPPSHTPCFRGRFPFPQFPTIPST